MTKDIQVAPEAFKLDGTEIHEIAVRRVDIEREDSFYLFKTLVVHSRHRVGGDCFCRIVEHKGCGGYWHEEPAYFLHERDGTYWECDKCHESHHVNYKRVIRVLREANPC